MEVDISTKYAGLTLKSPIIVGACSLTGNLENIKEIAKRGAGAVVLKSIFEEEIINEFSSILEDAQNRGTDDENLDYLDLKIKHQNVDTYLNLIKQAKNYVDIPIIASINCVSPYEWSFYAKKIEEAGADAIELNIFALPIDFEKTSQQIEEIYFKIISEIKKSTKIPITVKLSSYFTNLGKTIVDISKEGVAGLVFFNRFYNNDIDVHTKKVTTSEIFSRPSDYTLPMRWIAMTSGRVECSLAASTGIHTTETLLKMIFAGANAVQVVSTLYLNGYGTIEKMNNEIIDFMNKNNYEALSQIIGIASQRNIKNPVVYERFQFMKYFTDYTEII